MKRIALILSVFLIWLGSTPSAGENAVATVSDAAATATDIASESKQHRGK
ncbi:MAG: hypothetical protein OEM85_05570 [Gammaproteobacteria bacterium]|nr:hypothetical protein [Gammaproteobacteria bacterium]MDH3372828.1 hypothetical protein [Gammaproteobacteria bacterium]MDH3407982.1 hypothetical protein [Gammaproteobacteria bacterium]